MSRAQIERRLRENVRRLEAARSDLAVTAQQLVVLADEVEDLRLRSLVSDDRGTAAEHRSADRNLAALRRHHDETRRLVDELEADQDALLDRLGSRG